MNIKLTRSGGFMGGLFEKELAHLSLPVALQSIVQQLLDNRLQYGKLKTSKQLRDGYVYSIEIKPIKPPFKLIFDDGNIPAELSPLIDYFLATT
jgi:hypothetical protein